MIRSLAALFLLFLPFLTQASHLVGGNLSYEYIGEFSGQHRYKVTLTNYLDCGPNSNYPFTPPETSHLIGVYGHDEANPNDDKDLFTTVTVDQVDSIRIDPDNPPGCNVGESTCIDKKVFEGTVDLPSSFDGYHLYFHRCCRNNNIDNLTDPGAEATSYQAFIPPTLIENSSPQFADDPIPFLCVGDTTTLLNNAVDPDGDKLVFSFVDPYSSATATATDPNPVPPDPLGWPIPPVDWAAGFDVNQPFGTGGHAYINASTGLTEYMIPNQGRWVSTIEIKEYRNGDLVGISRRDLQFLAINCPSNPSPEHDSASLGSSLTDTTIQEGDSLCFPIEFQDPNGDSLFLSTKGPLFDSTQIDPEAVIDTPQTGDSTASLQFCWNTECGQGRDLPYQFSVSAEDDGCPPKTTDLIFEVEVEPTETPDAIQGPDPACEFDTGVVYHVDSTPGYSYGWSVGGGSIASGNGTDSIEVDWGPSGNGALEVHAINPNGCHSDTLTRTITIDDLPAADAGNDTNICIGDTVSIGGSPTGASGNEFAWSDGGSLNDDTLANPLAFPDTTTQYVVEVSQPGGCSSKDTVEVQVISSGMDAGNDTSICLGDTVQLNAIGADSVDWAPSYGLSDSTISDPLAYPDSTVRYAVYLEDTAAGCSYVDTLELRVDSLPTADAGPDTTICENGDARLGGDPTGPAGSDYLWSPAGSLSADSIADPIASPSDTTDYELLVTDTNGCQAQDTATVYTVTPPTADAGPDDSLCLGDSVQLNGSGSGDYAWTPDDSLSDDTIADPIAFPSDTTTYTLIVTDTNNCSDTDEVELVVHSLPTADAGPDLWLCPGDSIALDGDGGGDYAWSPASSLDDSTLEDPLAYPDDTTDYILEVIDTNSCTDLDTSTVFVNDEVPTEAGPDTMICPGDSVTLGGSPTGPSGTSYSWSPAASLSDPTLANPVAFPDTTTEYIVNTTNDTCTNADTVLVLVDTLIADLDAGPDREICRGDSTQLDASGAPSYSWIPPGPLSDPSIPDPIAFPDTSTDFVVTGSDSLGCRIKDTARVTVHPLPNVDAGADVGICRGGSASLMATGADSYQWRPSDSLSDPTIADPTAFPDTTTRYVVEGTDTNGCVNFDTVTVEVYRISTGPDTLICEGDEVQLEAFGPGTEDYSWSPSEGLSDTSIPDPIATPDSSIVYTVSGTDSSGCTDEDSIEVRTTVRPDARFETSMSADCDGQRWTFTDMSVDSDSSIWIYEDEGYEGREFERQIPYEEERQVRLIAVNQGTCRDTSEMDVEVPSFEEQFEAKRPNVFTPNGDGKNELFRLDMNGEYSSCAELRIYNRWGQLLFRTTGNNIQWDGYTMAGKKMSPGTYFYTMTVKDVKLEGKLQLME